MVSVDTPEDNKAFAEKEQADFPLLSDPDKKVANAYGVIPPDRPPDRQFASRWTFYIGPDGKILAIDKGATGRGINPATAGQDLITKLNELGVKKKTAPTKERAVSPYNTARKCYILARSEPCLSFANFPQLQAPSGPYGQV